MLSPPVRPMMFTSGNRKRNNMDIMFNAHVQHYLLVVRARMLLYSVRFYETYTFKII